LRGKILSANRGAQLVADDILKEAKERAAEVVKAAQQEAKTIVEGARLAAMEREKSELQKAREEGEQIYEQLLAEGRMRVKREMLQKREELIDAVFKDAEEFLRKRCSSKEYKKDLLRIVKSACRKLGSPDVVISANPRDLAIIKKEREKLVHELGGNLTFGRPIQTIGGVKVETPDARIVIDETFESRMKREFEALRIKVAKILFEGSG
jgi:V/A-type H+-transporting ATPase subunit E